MAKSWTKWLGVAGADLRRVEAATKPHRALHGCAVENWRVAGCRRERSDDKHIGLSFATRNSLSHRNLTQLKDNLLDGGIQLVCAAAGHL